jgi:dimethylamine/trimethylamine dehydrogenase
VRDWRVGQIERLANVTIYRDSLIGAKDAMEFAPRHIVVATGAAWRRDGVGRASGFPIEGFDGPGVFTPDDIMAQRLPKGPVVIFDDDHYYMGGVLAVSCREAGLPVTLVTPAAIVSAWTANTMEAVPIMRQLLRLGVEILPYTTVRSFGSGTVTLENSASGRVFEQEAGGLVTVTARLPLDDVYRNLAGMKSRWSDAGVASVTRVGDCYAPSTIQAAVYAGHKAARGLDEQLQSEIPRELPSIG